MITLHRLKQIRQLVLLGTDYISNYLLFTTTDSSFILLYSKKLRPIIYGDRKLMTYSIYHQTPPYTVKIMTLLTHAILYNCMVIIILTQLQLTLHHVRAELIKTYTGSYMVCHAWWGSWCVCGWQDVGMVILESSAVLFLPCLVTFLRFHPFHFY